MYIIRDQESGNSIDSFQSIDAAIVAITQYEDTDKIEGNYSENFYEIYDDEKREIIQ